MNKTILLAFALMLCLCASAWAAVPYTFSAGTPARAASVNANFTNLNDSLPGIANEFINESGIAISGISAVSVLSSQVITPPADGYVLALAMAKVRLDHATTGSTYQGAWFYITDSRTSTTLTGFDIFWGMAPGSSVSYPWGGVSVTSLYPATAGVPLRLYFLAQSISTETDMFVMDRTINLIFLPMSYGNVTLAGQIESLGAGRSDSTMPPH
jgi:hypothetical protein